MSECCEARGARLLNLSAGQEMKLPAFVGVLVGSPDSPRVFFFSFRLNVYVHTNKSVVVLNVLHDPSQEFES